LPALEPPGQLRVGPLAPHLRSGGGGPDHLRTPPEAEPGLARRRRPEERAVTSGAATAPAPTGLTVHSGGDQFTVTGPRPRLSWRLPAEAVRAASTELEARIEGSSRTEL